MRLGVVAVVSLLGCGGRVADENHVVLPDGALLECAPQFVYSTGGYCDDSTAVYWRGDRCEPVRCYCAGDDCDKGFGTVAACEETYRPCLERRR